MFLFEGERNILFLGWGKKSSKGQLTEIAFLTIIKLECTYSMIIIKMHLHLTQNGS